MINFVAYMYFFNDSFSLSLQIMPYSNLQSRLCLVFVLFSNLHYGSSLYLCHFNKVGKVFVRGIKLPCHRGTQIFGASLREPDSQ